MYSFVPKKKNMSNYSLLKKDRVEEVKKKNH